MKFIRVGSLAPSLPLVRSLTHIVPKACHSWHGSERQANTLVSEAACVDGAPCAASFYGFLLEPNSTNDIPMASTYGYHAAVDAHLGDETGSSVTRQGTRFYCVSFRRKMFVVILKECYMMSALRGCSSRAVGHASNARVSPVRLSTWIRANP